MRLIRPRKTSGFRPTEGKTHPTESTNQITRLGWHQGCPTFRKYPLKYSRSKGIAGSSPPFAFSLPFGEPSSRFETARFSLADQGPVKIAKIVERIGPSEARFRSTTRRRFFAFDGRVGSPFDGRFSSFPFFLFLFFLFLEKLDREENRGRPR